MLTALFYAGLAGLRGFTPDRSTLLRAMGAHRFLPLSLPDGHVRARVFRSQIFGAGTNQAIVVELLDHVGSPSADTRDREDRSEQVLVNAEDVVGGCGIEIYIGVQLLFRLDQGFNL